MRVPITVQVESFDLEEIQPRIDAIRRAFFSFLKETPRKSSRSKHGLMGPIGKLLTEVRSGRYDPESLKGYVVRIHEAGERQISRTALDNLQEGIDLLAKLLNESPVTVHERIFDRLDHGLYFELRKEALLSREALRQAWISFLRGKYGNESTLSEAWNEEVTSFDGLYLPRKSQGGKGKRATMKQQDIAAFWETQGSAKLTVEEDEE
ncbi:MAG: hypothetical protein ACOX2S_02930 [bacterium]